METLDQLLESNRQWAAEVKQDEPEFFSKLVAGQNPDILWIGCSDSRVPSNQILNLPPGDVFVHRNIANVVVHTDLNCLSVIQYAVEVLRVKSIIVCGHYGCGGISAALGNKRYGLIDNWLRHIKDVSRMHEVDLAPLSLEEQKDLLCELNVKEQVRNVCNTTIVQDAWTLGHKLSVHGLVYSLKDGILKDLSVSIDSKGVFLRAFS